MLRRSSPRQHVAQFFRQMAVLSNAGLALDRALEVCAQQTSSAWLQERVRHLSDDLRHGVRMSDALRQAGRPFTRLHAGVILAAESTGRYDDAFEELAAWEEKADAVERRMRSLLDYPLFVVAVAVVGTFVLLRFLAPLIKSVMGQVGGDASMPTRIVLALGDASANPRVLVPLALALPFLVWGARRVCANPRIRSTWERWSLHLPLVGGLLVKAWTVRMARCLHALMAAGLPMVHCLDLAAEASGNEYLGERVLKGAAFGVLKGETLTQALPSGVLSRAFMGMLAVGETSGTLPEMLERVADLHEVELGAQIEALFRATEPVLMGTVGVTVLLCLLCAFQPLYTLIMRL